MTWPVSVGKSVGKRIKAIVSRKKKRKINLVMGPKGRPDAKTNWSTVCWPQEELQLQLLIRTRTCNLPACSIAPQQPHYYVPPVSLMACKGNDILTLFLYVTFNIDLQHTQQIQFTHRIHSDKNYNSVTCYTFFSHLNFYIFSDLNFL
jgi:hypothetical protein